MSMVGTVVSGRPSQVRVFLRADTAEELVRLQLLTNAKYLGMFDYTDIQYVQGKWYAWFLVDVDRAPDILKGLNGTQSNARRSRTR